MDEQALPLIESIEKGAEVMAGDSMYDRIDFFPVMDYLQMESPTEAEREQLRYVTEWARKQGLNDQHELRAKLGTIEQKLGANPIGQSRISRIYQYLKLDSQIETLIKEQQSMTRHV